MNADFLAARIAATEAFIILYEDAITFLSTNPTRSYRLDTGQSVQEVTRFNLADLQKSYDSMLNRLATLEARRNGAQTQVRPLW